MCKGKVKEERDKKKNVSRLGVSQDLETKSTNLIKDVGSLDISHSNIKTEAYDNTGKIFPIGDWAVDRKHLLGLTENRRGLLLQQRTMTGARDAGSHFICKESITIRNCDEIVLEDQGGHRKRTCKI
jgi:hypothetical protein